MAKKIKIKGSRRRSVLLKTQISRLLPKAGLPNLLLTKKRTGYKQPLPYKSAYSIREAFRTRETSRLPSQRAKQITKTHLATKTQKPKTLKIGQKDICKDRSIRRNQLFKMQIAGLNLKKSPGQGGHYNRTEDSLHSCKKGS